MVPVSETKMVNKLW